MQGWGRRDSNSCAGAECWLMQAACPQVTSLALHRCRAQEATVIMPVSWGVWLGSSPSEM